MSSALLHEMVRGFVGGLMTANEAHKAHPHLKSFVSQVMERETNEDITDQRISHALWYAHDLVMKASSLPAFWRYLGKKQPRPSEYERAIRLLCLQLERLSA